jgi:hypothetical protein
MEAEANVHGCTMSKHLHARPSEEEVHVCGCTMCKRPATGPEEEAVNAQKHPMSKQSRRERAPGLGFRV